MTGRPRAASCAGRGEFETACRMGSWFRGESGGFLLATSRGSRA